MFHQPMGLVYDLDLFSKKLHRNSTSDRRRATTNYDKHGYPITTFGGSSYRDPVVHVLQVGPGVVVNFVEGPSSRHRTWPPQTMDYNNNKFNGRNGRSFQCHDPFADPRGIPSGLPPPPPPPLIRTNFNGRPLPPPPPPPSEFSNHPSSPRSPRFSVDEHHPDAHFSIPHHPQPYYEEEDPMEPPRPSLHVADPVFLDVRDSPPQHVSSPLDIPSVPNSPETLDSSFHSLSPSSSDSSSFNNRHPDDHRYYDAQQRSPAFSEHPPSLPSSPRIRRQSDFSAVSLTPKTRSVRFHDNPVLPHTSERRKGWFNRRGDELWDNEGSYVPAPEGDQYPADLQNYPEPGRGWMNEEGVVIDMKRRLIRKKLRPVLKKPTL
ncbi:hypothetical protein Clacol_004924 [Clathrus columnatus]|uniref:Uncharacterized protein n=1 Tax=Clathrus columnatus TaxID=1419009 RepID=A0AAV5A7U4_9AGAM|nr:hypothetical protein Clacol_004924 [Clathrus columnatus]